MTITDGSGRLQLVFFGSGVHKPHKELLPGTRAMFAGKVSVFNRRLQLAHPAYELLRGDAEETVETWAGALIPIYPATAKLESWKIGKAIQTVLPSAQEVVDPSRTPSATAAAWSRSPRPSSRSTARTPRPTSRTPAPASSGTRPSSSRSPSPAAATPTPNSPRWPANRSRTAS